jgi:hypothetical protein
MPNGGDKNLVRLIITIAGFRARYDSWPTMIRLPEISLADLREHVLTPESFERLSALLEFVADDDSFVAMDGTGRMSHYHEFSGDFQDQAEVEAWLSPEVRREAQW